MQDTISVRHTKGFDVQPAGKCQPADHKLQAEDEGTCKGSFAAGSWGHHVDYEKKHSCITV